MWHCMRHGLYRISVALCVGAHHVIDFIAPRSRVLRERSGCIRLFSVDVALRGGRSTPVGCTRESQIEIVRNFENQHDVISQIDTLQNVELMKHFKFFKISKKDMKTIIMYLTQMKHLNLVSHLLTVTLAIDTFQIKQSTH